MKKTFIRILNICSFTTPYEENLSSMIISSTRSSNWNAPSLKLQRGAAHTCFRSSVTFFRKQLGSILHISYEKCIVVSVSAFQSVLNAEKLGKNTGAWKINLAATIQTGIGERGDEIIDFTAWFIDFIRITEHEWKSDHLRMSTEWSGSIAITKCILSTALNGDTIKCGATIPPTIITKTDL